MEKNTTEIWWVLKYGESPQVPNSGEVAKFDNFQDADSYAVAMNEKSIWLYSVTSCFKMVSDYCKAYSLDRKQFI